MGNLHAKRAVGSIAASVIGNSRNVNPGPGVIRSFGGEQPLMALIVADRQEAGLKRRGLCLIRAIREIRGFPRWNMRIEEKSCL
jgi:hypothetical protein